MAAYIRTNFLGTTITVTLTGLPITITGEVLALTTADILALKVDGKTVYINNAVIAAFF